MATAKIAPTITGQGTTKTGERVFTVASRTEANHWYLVVVHADQLECQCKGSLYYGRCAHRQVVHDRLVEERNAKREAEAKAAAKARDAAPLYRDNRPFSIFKAS
jgi:hypothetical protein